MYTFHSLRVYDPQGIHTIFKVVNGNLNSVHNIYLPYTKGRLTFLANGTKNRKNLLNNSRLIIIFILQSFFFCPQRINLHWPDESEESNVFFKT